MPVKLIDINIKNAFGMTLFDIMKAQATLSNVRSFVSMVGLIQRDVQLSCSDFYKCGRVSLEVAGPRPKQ
ncbi:hypothetical protein F2Q69_00002977 [Brassica cretica]|uniref:Uncharacterized protein n=1 Tax=Brassica cretica TaxID=69181 RepID=A0A8S9PAI0_BRACR|nr:hypothetical protein F2Q69_00002977 [Brassica cretica]